MSRTTCNYPVNRVKARHFNAIPYKRERWDANKELNNVYDDYRHK